MDRPEENWRWRNLIRCMEIRKEKSEPLHYSRTGLPPSSGSTPVLIFNIVLSLGSYKFCLLHNPFHRKQKTHLSSPFLCTLLVYFLQQLEKKSPYKFFTICKQSPKARKIAGHHPLSSNILPP